MRISDWSSDVCSSDLVTRGRGGTHIADPGPIAQEGFAADTVLRDVGTGNPDPARIPDPTPALGRIVGRPVPYGEIGRAACRERGCQYGSHSVVAVSIQKKHN